MAKTATIIGAAAAALILIGLGPLPIGYYTQLRWGVCIAAAWIAVLASQNGKAGWLFLLVPVAILFNPIAPVYLMTRAAWVPWDMAAAVILAVAGTQADKAPAKTRA
ncbi:DUF6804 family protein [Arthrobacter sp. ok362]|uniref:DUF6804 family protein n=1 Tax=Arthrobacter sp. ok362 TaxID=1761745 RepID=UPI000889F1C3|nr:DUF6804 family protein [Arthrobacter sp. ok362]SDM03085.1 hypothetical protein SAMN04487913_12121 [Arthrobacter sp. ok362]